LTPPWVRQAEHVGSDLVFGLWQWRPNFGYGGALSDRALGVLIANRFSCLGFKPDLAPFGERVRRIGGWLQVGWAMCVALSASPPAAIQKQHPIGPQLLARYTIAYYVD
jgi:hypothetical protein